MSSNFERTISRRLADIEQKNNRYLQRLKSEIEQGIAECNFYCEICACAPAFKVIQRQIGPGEFSTTVESDCAHFNAEITEIREKAQRIALAERQA